MEKSTMYGIGIFLVIIMGGLFFIKGNSVNGNVVAQNPTVLQGEMQKVILSKEGYNYKEVVAQANKPIAVSADNSVNGCLRSAVFTINGKKYSKYLRTPEDILELPALSKGTYSFSCSMGMGYGKLTVK